MNGQECILILGWKGKKKSHGYPEREQHVEDMKNGVDSYGVICTAKDPQASGSRTITSFDHDELLRFGELIYDNDRVYASIVGRVSVNHVARKQTSQSTLLPDMKAILSKSGKTTKDALAKARIGQGVFRANVLDMWDSKCCVTGICTPDAIRASHIKPWRNSTDSERLDPLNGLPLVATLDALFDSGLITFSDDGQLLISPLLPPADVNLLGLAGLRLRDAPNTSTQQFLTYHRDTIFVSKI
ncbi:HNH endonuclease signature motif containing protein [Phycisphaeraceae bacterium D3-23]